MSDIIFEGQTSKAISRYLEARVWKKHDGTIIISSCISFIR